MVADDSAAREATPEREINVTWQTSLDALALVNDARRYIRVNEPATRLLGAPLEKILGRRIDDFTPQNRRAPLEALWSDCETQGGQYGTYEVLRGDGSISVVEYRATWQYGPGAHLIAARPLGVRGGVPGLRARLAVPALTRREREVLQMAADGQAVADIADALVLSSGTVKTHFRNVHKKLGVGDRASAVAEGLRRGLIE